VIDIKTITRPLPVAKTRKGPIETVSEPVDSEADDSSNKGLRVPSRQRITSAGHDHAQETKKGQVVGVDPGRHAARQPRKYLLLQGSENTLLLARCGFERGLLHPNYVTSGWSVLRLRG
jgi:hypothetical protein